jgi:HEAT repeat protein
MDIQLLRTTPPWEWPEDAGKVILRTLRDPEADETDRLLAAELAGEFVVANDELVLALLSLVGDNDQPDELRSRTAIALGPILEYGCMEFEDVDDDDEFMDMGDHPITEDAFAQVRDTFRQLYLAGAVPDGVRRSILEAAVRAPQDWHIDAVRAAYYSGEDAWKRTGIFGMYYVRGFEEEIVKALKSDDDSIRYHAVHAAGNWALDEAWSHITPLVSPPHPDKDLLLAAIEATAAIRPAEASALLGDLLENEDEDVVDAVHEALMFAEGEMDLDDDDIFL